MLVPVSSVKSVSASDHIANSSLMGYDAGGVVLPPVMVVAASSSQEKHQNPTEDENDVVIDMIADTDEDDHSPSRPDNLTMPLSPGKPGSAKQIRYLFGAIRETRVYSFEGSSGRGSKAEPISTFGGVGGTEIVGPSSSLSSSLSDLHLEGASSVIVSSIPVALPQPSVEVFNVRESSKSLLFWEKIFALYCRRKVIVLAVLAFLVPASVNAGVELFHYFMEGNWDADSQFDDKVDLLSWPFGIAMDLVQSAMMVGFFMPLVQTLRIYFFLKQNPRVLESYDLDLLDFVNQFPFTWLKNFCLPVRIPFHRHLLRAFSFSLLFGFFWGGGHSLMAYTLCSTAGIACSIRFNVLLFYKILFGGIEGLIVFFMIYWLCVDNALRKSRAW